MTGPVTSMPDPCADLREDVKRLTARNQEMAVTIAALEQKIESLAVREKDLEAKLRGANHEIDDIAKKAAHAVEQQGCTISFLREEATPIPFLIAESLLQVQETLIRIAGTPSGGRAPRVRRAGE